MGMTPEHVAVLLECRRRMLALETAEPQWWERYAWLEQVEHGPFFSVPEWFGTNADHMRMRYLRAIADLDAAGLLVRYCRWGRKLTSIRLTAEGMTLAGELQTQAEAPAG